MMSDFDSIRNAVMAESIRVSQVRPWWIVALALAAVNLAPAAIVLQATAFERPDFSDVRWPFGFGFLILGAVATVAAIGPRWHVIRLSLLVAAAALGIGAVATLPPPRAAVPNYECFLTEVGLSLLPLVAFVYALSRFAPSRARALVGGLAAGSAGLALLHWRCPDSSFTHVMVAHLTPWVGLALLALVTRSFVRTYSYAP